MPGVGDDDYESEPDPLAEGLTLIQETLDKRLERIERRLLMSVDRVHDGINSLGETMRDVTLSSAQGEKSGILFQEEVILAILDKEGVPSVVSINETTTVPSVLAIDGDRLLNRNFSLLT